MGNRGAFLGQRENAEGLNTGNVDNPGQGPSIAAVVALKCSLERRKGILESKGVSQSEGEL